MRPNARACSLSKRGPVFASCPATELLSALVQSGGMVGAPPVHQRNGESVRSRGSRQLLFRFSDGLRIHFNKGIASREGSWNRAGRRSGVAWQQVLRQLKGADRTHREAENETPAFNGIRIIGFYGVLFLGLDRRG